MNFLNKTTVTTVVAVIAALVIYEKFVKDKI